ncbi:bacteriohemerythrin [Vibrio sp. F74]|uniref:bacteriohemerythrin n=1 Tax=Vibrio sp. F74 TaxID=700020 RepID=UPI0035F5574B
MSTQWTKDLSVGDEAIDDDHKGLFKLIDELSTANMSHSYINSILDRLKHYTEEHFSKEEVYMKQVNFPGLDEHLAQHRAFEEWLKTIRSMYARFPQSPFIVGDSVNSYLQRWLKEHILEEDMKYRDFIVSHKKQ